MHENATVSSEITEYISVSDFKKLTSIPSITEDDISFKESKSINAILKEFGY